jgi:hypothetical protein
MFFIIYGLFRLFAFIIKAAIVMAIVLVLAVSSLVAMCFGKRICWPRIGLWLRI